jgi:hypothetical protein
MCTGANSASVPDSFQAVVTSILAVTGAVAALVLALLTVPWRAARPQPTRHGKPASIRHIEIQVHGIVDQPVVSKECALGKPVVPEVYMKCRVTTVTSPLKTISLNA